jgi:hypothetical protein
MIFAAPACGFQASECHNVLQSSIDQEGERECRARAANANSIYPRNHTTNEIGRSQRTSAAISSCGDLQCSYLDRCEMTTERGRSIRRAVCLITTGLSVGWIMGLSASPVTQAVLATLLGLVNALVVTLPTAGILDTTEKSDVKHSRRVYLSRRSRDESLLPPRSPNLICGVRCIRRCVYTHT